MTLPSGTIAFLFTDIEGSTRLSAQLGDAFGAILTRHFELLDAAVVDAGGTPVASEGDALFAVFPTVRQAVDAAVNAQRALAAEMWPSGAPVRVRMGVHVGEAVLGGRNYTGLEVNRAARVMAAGWGGEILVSGAASALLGSVGGRDGIRVRDMGTFLLKDLAEPERLYQVVADGLASNFPPPRSESAHVATNLPTPLSTFVGRRAEVRAVSDLLLTERIVTLIGPGGTGKTRLAIEVARNARDRFADGVWFVALDVVRDPALVVATIATTLGVPDQPGRTTAQTLAEFLATRELLLVLDNLEQVVEAAPDVAALLQAAPKLRILGSSREPLQIAGERPYPVPPLTVPEAPGQPTAAAIADQEAVQLFVQRARTARADFALTDDNAANVAAICRALDGLPLAIELAAARANVLSPAQIVERLDHRLALLASTRRDLPPRQRSLRGAIDWSHDLLDEPERVAFRRLGAFAGGADMAAIQAVVDPERELANDALDIVSALVDRSLARSVVDGESSRVELLETIRVFAEEKLGESADEGLVRDRHAAWFADVARSARNVLSDARPDVHLASLDRELPNLRAAVAWLNGHDRTEEALVAVADLGDFWHMRKHISEARALINQMLDATAAAGDTSTRARAEILLGELGGWQGDYAVGAQHASLGLAMAERLGDTVQAGVAHVSFGWATIGTDPDQSRRHFETALDALQGSDRLSSLDGALQGYPLSLILLGRLDDAERQARLALEIAEARGNRYINTFNFLTLGAIARLRGDDDTALAQAAEALDRSTMVGGQLGLALAMDLVADVLLRRGDPSRATVLASAAEHLRAEAGGGPQITLAGLEPLLPRLEAASRPEEFRTALAEGRALPTEEAVRRAYEVARPA